MNPYVLTIGITIYLNMSDTKSFIVDRQLLEDMYHQQITNIGLNYSKGIQLLEDSEDNMDTFLKEIRDDDAFGYEYIYDSEVKQTSINLLAEDKDSIIFNDFKENNKVSFTNSTQKFKNVKENDTEIAAAKVELLNDYWVPIKQHDDFDYEPLRRIMNRISRNQNSEVTTILQITSQPIKQKQWNKRVSYRSIIVGLINMLYILPIVAVFYVFKKIIYPVLLSMTNKHNNKLNEEMSIEKNKDEMSIFKGAFIDLFTRFKVSEIKKRITYKKEKLLKEVDHSKETEVSGIEMLFKRIAYGKLPYLELESAVDTYTTIEQVDELIERISEKSTSRGYVTNIRIMCIADKNNTQSAHDKLLEIKKDIENIYFDNEYIYNQNGFEVNIANSKNDLREIIKNISSVDTMVRNKKEVKSDYFLKKWRAYRTTPMILTRPELTSILHIPDEVDDAIDVKDNVGELPEGLK